MNTEIQNTDLSNKAKILLVDDNVQLLNMLNDVLVEHGYDVMSAEDGEQGLNLYKDFLPDIVITDIVMPEVDGIEFLLGLRKINPNVRVIAMSGGNSGHAESYLRIAEKLGADIILNKPFEISELLKEIKNIESNIK